MWIYGRFLQAEVEPFMGMAIPHAVFPFRFPVAELCFSLTVAEWLRSFELFPSGIYA